MKIVHIITRLILGGAQENTILTCEGQHELGHEVTLITGPAIGPEGELFSRAKSGEYSVETVEHMVREIKPAYDWKAAREIEKILIRTQPDVVHTHSSKAGILGREVAFKLRKRGKIPQQCKIVHGVHGLAYHKYNSKLKNAIYVALEKRCAKKSDAIICVADAMTQSALEFGVGSPEQYHTVYSGMEVDTFLRDQPGAQAFRKSIGVSENEILVTQVSRIAELKGHDDIIDALKFVQDKNIRFCFVGDGYWRERIEKRLVAEGLADRVKFTGLVEPERIPEIMHATDILIHLSYREGLARTLPQALLSQTPAISYDVDGAREVVNSETGILLPAPETLEQNQCAELIAQSIEKLARDPELRKRMGQAGRELCKVRFDYRTMVSEIQKVYDQLI